PSAIRPHHFNISVPRCSASVLENLFAPMLVRERGFFARTLRLGPAPVPQWLLDRRVDGTVSIDALDIGDTQVRVDSARLLWDGAQIRLAHLSAHGDSGSVDGEVAIDLGGRVPQYHFNGKLQDVTYKSGKLDFDGTWESEGGGTELLGASRAEGMLRGRSIP